MPKTVNTVPTWWGLRHDISPCFGARLVQEGNCVHYLADRASITGEFSEADLRHPDQTFPLQKNFRPKQSVNAPLKLEANGTT